MSTRRTPRRTTRIIEGLKRGVQAELGAPMLYVCAPRPRFDAAEGATRAFLELPRPVWGPFATKDAAERFKATLHASCEAVVCVLHEVPR